MLKSLVTTMPGGAEAWVSSIRQAGRRADVSGLLTGALVGTAVLTAIMEGAQARRVTRMSLPFMLGTMVTARRPLVRVSGTALHFMNGIGFASGYALVFGRAGRAGWRLGAIVGALHGLVVLVAALPIVQEVHPRMAEEDEGPDPTPMLQPPGFLGLNYGVQTPAVTMAAHLAYGAIVGALYRVPAGRVSNGSPKSCRAQRPAWTRRRVAGPAR